MKPACLHAAEFQKLRLELNIKITVLGARLRSFPPEFIQCGADFSREFPVKQPALNIRHNRRAVDLLQPILRVMHHRLIRRLNFSHMETQHFYPAPQKLFIHPRLTLTFGISRGYCPSENFQISQKRCIMPAMNS